MGLHRVLHHHYPRLDVVLCDDRYFGVKYLYRRGLERRNVKLKKLGREKNNQKKRKIYPVE